MTILNKLQFQLKQVVDLLEKDFQKDLSCSFDFYIDESNTKFIDLEGLRSYVITTSITNFYLLNLICQLCMNLVILWDERLRAYSGEKIEYPKAPIFNSSLDFPFEILQSHNIKILDDRFVFCETPEEIDVFLSKGNYEIYSYEDIYERCFSIYMLLSVAFPKHISLTFNLNHELERYLRNNTLYFRTFEKTYKINEFTQCKNSLELDLVSYNFMHKNVERQDKKIIKSVMLSSLKSLKKIQVDSIFEDLIDDAIYRVKRDFKEIKGKQETSHDSYKTEKNDNSVKYKFGMLYAAGKLNEHIEINTKGQTVFKNGMTAPGIARRLGDNRYNKYILATINNYSNENANGNKNIFNSYELLHEIIQTLKDKNIKIDSYFLKRFDLLHKKLNK